MGVIRTHTERLEKIIDAGVELRHNMRVKTETKTQIIAKQRETILNQSQMINELEKEVKELTVKVDEKQHQRRMNLDEIKQHKAFQLAEHKKEIRSLKNTIRELKTYIKEQNGGTLPQEWMRGDE